MTQIHRVAILIPLAVGACAVLCTILIHALALGATVNYFRHERRLGRAGAGLWIDLTIVVRTMSIAFGAHLIEIALWAGLFVICGEFQEFGTAYYHSAVNYTTLGYGDVIMSPTWKLLGAAGSSRWSAYVRCFNCDDFCCHYTVDSCEVCGSQKLRCLPRE